MQMTNVTLRESVSENPLVFALSLHKQQREHRFEVGVVYILCVCVVGLRWAWSIYCVCAYATT